MRRTRAQAWWDEIRYGTGLRNALTAAAVVGGVVALALVLAARAPSGAQLVDRQRRMEAECVARGGHVVLMLFPERGQRDRACYGG